MNKNYIIGKKIRNGREEKKLSQKKFAKLLNISQASVSKYESGENIPRMNKLREIASLLELPLTHFLDEEKDDESESFEDTATLDRKEILQVIQEFLGKIDKPGKKETLLEEPLLNFCISRIESGYYNTTRQLQIIRLLELIEEMSSSENS